MQPRRCHDESSPDSRTMPDQVRLRDLAALGRLNHRRQSKLKSTTPTHQAQVRADRRSIMKDPKSLVLPAAVMAAVTLLMALPVRSADARECSRQTTKQRTEDGYSRSSTLDRETVPSRLVTRARASIRKPRPGRRR
jgi:hypothetical protein